jgi:hypothetical protein
MFGEEGGVDELDLLEE